MLNQVHVDSIILNHFDTVLVFWNSKSVVHNESVIPSPLIHVVMLRCVQVVKKC